MYREKKSLLSAVDTMTLSVQEAISKQIQLFKASVPMIVWKGENLHCALSPSTGALRICQRCKYFLGKHIQCLF